MIELTEQLRVLLEEHGAADLLRAMSASARGLAEKQPEDEDEWIDAAAAAAQAAEALTPIDDDDETTESDEDENGENEEGEGEDAPVEAHVANPSAPPPHAESEPTPSSPPDGASSMKTHPILPLRKDVTHWRARRVSEDRKVSTPLVWGDDGVEVSEWPIKELSVDTLRGRWGAGRYVLYWFGPRGEGGKRMPMGGSRMIHLLERPGDPRASEVGEVTHVAAPSPVVPSAPGELLALAAMRSQAAGGGDMAAMLQLLAFMDERQERQRQAQAQEGRLAAERYRADLEVMLERERLATKERIAQIEATAHAQARGARGGPALDPEALAEAIGRRVQEAITSDDDDDGQDASPATTLAAAAPSDLATMVNALKETLAPLLAVLATKLVNDPAGGPAAPAAYQPRGGNSHAAE